MEFVTLFKQHRSLGAGHVGNQLFFLNARLFVRPLIVYCLRNYHTLKE